MIVATMGSGNRMNRSAFVIFCIVLIACACQPTAAAPQQNPAKATASSDTAKGDLLRQMQLAAVETEQSNWVHWGDRKDKFLSLIHI